MNIEGKLNELNDLISSEADSEFTYQWEDENNDKLIINFLIRNKSYRYEFNLHNMDLITVVDNEIEYQKNVKNEDEGFDIIEKDIHEILNISEHFIIRSFHKFNESFNNGI